MTTTSQGYIKSNYFIDAGLRFEFLKNKQASISLNVNDIFRTRRQNIISESPCFTRKCSAAGSADFASELQLEIRKI